MLQSILGCFKFVFLSQKVNNVKVFNFAGIYIVYLKTVFTVLIIVI